MLAVQKRDDHVDGAEPAAYGQPLSPRPTLIFFAVRSDRAEDAVESIKTALPQGSLLYTSRGGAWHAVAASPDWSAMLTGRQTDILEALKNGKSNKEIGRALGLSHFTVRNHISQLMRLFNASTRGALGATWGGLSA